MNEEARALVILPTYNEVDNLEPLIQDIIASGLGLDILVIDDNSPDGTGEVAERLAMKLPEVHVMHRPGKIGLGTAYVAGFKWALERGYDYILQMDCDFSHHPQYLPIFLRRIKQADLVIGSRYVPGGGIVNWGVLRKLLSGGGNVFARMMLGLRVRDCTGGFRCYRRHVIEDIPWGEVDLEGYGFLIGLAYQVQRLGNVIVEFPIVFEDRRVGQSKMSFRIAVEAFVYVTRTALTQRWPIRWPKPELHRFLP